MPLSISYPSILYDIIYDYSFDINYAYQKLILIIRVEYPLLISPSYQLNLQIMLATIAVICVPVMLLGKPILKFIKHLATRKKRKPYGHLGSGKNSLTKEEERSYLFDDENIKSDSLNLEIKDFSSFRPKDIG